MEQGKTGEGAGWPALVGHPIVCRLKPYYCIGQTLLSEAQIIVDKMAGSGWQTAAGNVRLWAVVAGLGLAAAASAGFMMHEAYAFNQPLDYLIPAVLGLLGAALGGLVWSLRPHEMATQIFALNGLAWLVSLLCIAAFPALGAGSDPLYERVLTAGNSLANQAFYLTLIALFITYPVRLVPARWAWALLALLIPYAVVYFSGLAGRDILWVVVPLLELLAIIILIVVQWLRTRTAPRERAALMWLALSVIVGTSFWCCLLLLDLIRGVHDGTGGTLLLILFFPFYLGLAMGVARFCLVELQDWTFRILFYLIAALLFFAIDAALVMILRLGGAGALGISLLVVAFGYLPLRDVIWRRFTRGSVMTEAAMFAAVMDIVFAPMPSHRQIRWLGLLRDLFNPLRLDEAAARPDSAIIDDGLALCVPAVADSPAYILRFAHQGRGLFSPSQLALVRQLVALLATAAHSRDAYERGAAEERRRLAQDLHDDVGARLLSGLNIADERTRPVLHAAIADIRGIAGGLMGAAAPLDQVLADIRYECVRRLDACGVTVEWTPWPQDAPLIQIDYRRQKALASGLREAVSNVIRHAGATTVEVETALVGDSLHMVFRDNGAGFPESVMAGEPTPGRESLGLPGLHRRFGEAGGAVRFGNREGGGAEVVFDLPLGF